MTSQYIINQMIEMATHGQPTLGDYSIQIVNGKVVKVVPFNWTVATGFKLDSYIQEVCPPEATLEQHDDVYIDHRPDFTQYSFQQFIEKQLPGYQNKFILGDWLNHALLCSIKIKNQDCYIENLKKASYYIVIGEPSAEEVRCYVNEQLRGLKPGSLTVRKLAECLYLSKAVPESQVWHRGKLIKLPLDAFSVTSYLLFMGKGRFGFITYEPHLDNKHIGKSNGTLTFRANRRMFRCHGTIRFNKELLPYMLETQQDILKSRVSSHILKQEIIRKHTQKLTESDIKTLEKIEDKMEFLLTGTVKKKSISKRIIAWVVT